MNACSRVEHRQDQHGASRYTPQLNKAAHAKSAYDEYLTQSEQQEPFLILISTIIRLCDFFLFAFRDDDPEQAKRQVFGKRFRRTAFLPRPVGEGRHLAGSTYLPSLK